MNRRLRRLANRSSAVAVLGINHIDHARFVAFGPVDAGEGHGRCLGPKEHVGVCVDACDMALDTHLEQRPTDRPQSLSSSKGSGWITIMSSWRSSSFSMFSLIA